MQLWDPWADSTASEHIRILVRNMVVILRIKRSCGDKATRLATGTQKKLISWGTWVLIHKQRELFEFRIEKHFNFLEN